MLSERLTILLILLMSLTSCSTIEVSHVPLECEGQPLFPLDIMFLPEDLDGAKPEFLRKWKERIIILRERIDYQCELMKEHNRLHEGL